jgi:hypothetical protein
MYFLHLFKFNFNFNLNPNLIIVLAIIIILFISFLSEFSLFTLFQLKYFYDLLLKLDNYKNHFLVKSVKILKNFLCIIQKNLFKVKRLMNHLKLNFLFKYF